MGKIYKSIGKACCFCLISGIFACNKLVRIPAPINSITASQVFNSDQDATSAVTAIYENMSFGSTNGSSLVFSNGGTTIYPGLSADELADVYPQTDQFLSNTLLSNNTTPYSAFWQPAYFDIFMANAVISNLQASNGVSEKTRMQLIGEAEFLRALSYFYLVNLYGGVPLVITTDFNKTALLPRADSNQVYSQIITDLRDAQSKMVSDFSFSNGMPTRANKWTALALLARVYLYSGNWSAADSAATAVISSGSFHLLSTDSLNQVFLPGSGEAILQLETANINPWATAEGNAIEPSGPGEFPGYQLEPGLVGAFEAGDQRWAYWVDSISYGGVTYYYPIKYQVFNGQGTITEYYMVLRFAEQFLIRAEAEANGAGGGTPAAMADLNTIRIRAGLNPLSDTVADIMGAVRQERRIEYFAEWGHRWLDLKRWGIAVYALENISYKMGNINPDQLLYPIPLSEIQDDPNLIQNPGYSSH